MKLLFPLLIFSIPLCGQEACEDIMKADGSSERICWHSNGSPSTQEWWDASHQWGRFTAYDSRGLQLLDLELRNVAGHARVQLSYHANGQVQQVGYSSSPDGGIQRISQEYHFSELGVLTSTREENYPFQVIPLNEPWEDEISSSEESAACGAISLSVYEVVNTTRRRVWIKLDPRGGGAMFAPPSRMLLLKPGATAVVDSVLMAGVHLPADQVFRYRAEPFRGKRAIEVISEQAADRGSRRVYRLCIVEKH
ncbi:MAG: hypothetical protein ACK505_09085 [Flavobacteriales bacterium]|jgi:hypothetical protein